MTVSKKKGRAFMSFDVRSSIPIRVNTLMKFSFDDSDNTANMAIQYALDMTITFGNGGDR